jgi:hypothetical protein
MCQVATGLDPWSTLHAGELARVPGIARMRVRALWNERIDENLKVAAPLAIGRQSNDSDGDWWWRMQAHSAAVLLDERGKTERSRRISSSP